MLAEIDHSAISSHVSTLMIYCENYKSINTSFGNEKNFVFLEEKQAYYLFLLILAGFSEKIVKLS